MTAGAAKPANRRCAENGIGREVEDGGATATSRRSRRRGTRWHAWRADRALERPCLRLLVPQRTLNRSRMTGPAYGRLDPPSDRALRSAGVTWHLPEARGEPRSPQKPPHIVESAGTMPFAPGSRRRRASGKPRYREPNSQFRNANRMHDFLSRPPAALARFMPVSSATILSRRVASRPHGARYGPPA